MLDYLRSNGHIKTAGANRRRVVVYSDLMEHQLWCRILCEPNTVRAGTQPTTSYPRLASSRQSAPLPHPMSMTRRTPNSAQSVTIRGHKYASVCGASADP